MHAVARFGGVSLHRCRSLEANSNCFATITGRLLARLSLSSITPSPLLRSAQTGLASPSRSFVTLCPTLLYSVTSFPTTKCVSLQQHLSRRSISTGQVMERNGELRKRKTSPVDIIERPIKQFKPDIYGVPDDDWIPDDTPTNGMESDGDGSPTLPVTATAETPEWQATIEKVVRNVVSIHFCQTCSFDTDAATASEATGFIVDAEKGYILTNRHVVGPGPFWGYCIFDNHEEVGLAPTFQVNAANACVKVRCLPCISRSCS